MDASRKITARITRVFKRETADPRNSFHSWEHCYQLFSSRPTNLDLASLHLGFYLASWGMYRGSAKIRDFDYLIHRPVAEEILKAKYDALRGASSNELLAHFDALLWPLIKQIRGSGKKPGLYPTSVNVSDTLVTKILMGTLGCTPAYDRFFKDGLKLKGCKPSFSRKNLRALLQFCEQNPQGFVDGQNQIQTSLQYPVMRVVDIYFHDIGRALDRIKQR
jgi:hypothetical protein